MMVLLKKNAASVVGTIMDGEDTQTLLAVKFLFKLSCILRQWGHKNFWRWLALVSTTSASTPPIMSHLVKHYLIFPLMAYLE